MTELENILAHAQPGFTVTSRANGRIYEKQDDDTWTCRDTGETFINSDLAEKEGENLE